ncbi:aminodeoxychorismate lyase [Sulfurifustis variabilis]|uniref:aminodeoxychorismate lyase n=1 Tax=Sulfurifustis variabilis TaxID=1675686 RepID=UPI000BBB3EE1|nr:aminodeoxychorismate lyase [Sulfurifustis variabilis]
MSTRLRVLVNGEPEDRVPVSDRGFQYGDGLFETIAVREGEPVRWERHLARLGLGCERLGIPPPDARVLREEARRLSHGRERAVLKLVYTRGPSPRGYAPPVSPTPTRALIVSEWPSHRASPPEEGVAVCLCRQRLAANARLAGIKHLNRLEQILARAEWRDEYAEGLMLNARGDIVDGTMSNVFAVLDDVLVTPEIVDCGVAGVMRNLVLQRAAALGIPCRVRALALVDLRRAHEIFLTNSVIGVLPVGRFEERAVAVGAVTRALRRAIAEDDNDVARRA